MTKAWVAGKGYSGLDKDVEENTADFGPRRFWLRPGASTQIVFLDDEPLRFYEHQVCINGSWQNWATCPGEDECPLCKIGDKPSYVGVWTIIDRTEFTDRKGVKHKDEVRLFVAKPKVMAKLSRRSDKLRTEKGKADGLTGVVFEVSRGDEKSASTGDDFELVGKAKAEMLAGKKVPDYMTLFKPNTRKLLSLARKLTGAAAGGGEDGGGVGRDDGAANPF